MFNFIGYSINTIRRYWDVLNGNTSTEELKTIKAAYCEAYEAHKVKVDRYIKRYGTSKVHAWTYRGEA